MIARLLRVYRNTPWHCGMQMVWNTWRACWECSDPRCGGTA